MALYAKLKNNIVQNVIIAEQDFINTLEDKESYRLLNNENVSKDYTYNEAENFYYPPQPYPSWIWNNEQSQWTAPIPMPEDDMLCDEHTCKCCVWNEATRTWDRLHRTQEEDWIMPNG